MNAFWERHAALREFLLFNLLSNCATLVNLLATFVGTHVLFRAFRDRPFSFLVFQYRNIREDLGLAGFLSFLFATALAQTVNFSVQRKLVFRASGDAGKAALRFSDSNLCGAAGLYLAALRYFGFRGLKHSAAGGNQFSRDEILDYA